MAWISVHESIDGPKLRNLYKTVGCSKFEAVGVLNFLWFWGLANAEKDGFIPYADKEDIVRYLYGAAAGCKIDTVKIVDALVESGWVDVSTSGLYIHDWETWQEQWYKAKERRESDAKRKRESRRGKPSSQEQDDIKEKPDIPQDCPADSPTKKVEKTKTPDKKQDQETREEDEPVEKPEDPRYTPVFEDFWSSYPRRIGKGEAYRKYRARRNDGYSDAELLTAAKNYAVACKRLGTAKEYIKHPKTFLSDSLPFLDYIPKEDKGKPEAPEGSNPFAEYEKET